MLLIWAYNDETELGGLMRKSALFIMLAFVAFGLSAQGYSYLQQIQNPNAGESDLFGSNMALDYEYAVIGNYNANNHAGCAYVYHWNGSTWGLQAILTDPDGDDWDYFGWSVAIFNEYIAVGAPYDDQGNYNEGSLFLFKRSGTTWNQIEKFTPDDAYGASEFGWSVDFSGSHIAVGAPGHEVIDGPVDAGCVYLIHNDGDDNWTMINVPGIVDTPVANERLGTSVDIEYNYLHNRYFVLAGAYENDEMGTSAGAVYLMAVNNSSVPVQADKIVPDDLAFDDRFGYGLALTYENTDNCFSAAVSAIHDKENGYRTGKVYMIKWNTGADTSTIVQELQPPNLDSAQLFGSSIFLIEGYAFITAPAYNNYEGVLYVYQRQEGVWAPLLDLYPDGGATLQSFGSCIDVYQNKLMVGAPANDEVVSNSGCVYFYQSGIPVPNGTGELFISEVSDNLPGELESTGFIELYNSTYSFMDVSSLILEQGYNNAGAFTPSGVQYTLDAAIISPDGTLLIGNGADQSVFTAAWDIPGYLHYEPGSSDLAIASGFAYRLSSPETRAVIDMTINVGANEQADQSTIGAWSIGTPAAGTPGELAGEQTLPVELSSFTAVQTTDNCAMLLWVTESETNMYGYYVYRSDSDELDSAIAVSGLVEAQGCTSSQTYSFTDRDVEMEQTYHYWLESVDLSGSIEFFGPVTVSITEEEQEEDHPGIILHTGIEHCYPNPFNPSTTVSFSMAKDDNAEICVFNLRGQKVRTLTNGFYVKGNHQTEWNGCDYDGKPCGSGVYFVRMKSGQNIYSSRVLMLK